MHFENYRGLQECGREPVSGLLCRARLHDQVGATSPWLTRANDKLVTGKTSGHRCQRLFSVYCELGMAVNSSPGITPKTP